MVVHRLDANTRHLNSSLSNVGVACKNEWNSHNERLKSSSGIPKKRIVTEEIEEPGMCLGTTPRNEISRRFESLQERYM